MTNTEILAIAAHVNYAAVGLSGRDYIGPGPEEWESRLSRLSPEQRETLEGKIAKWKWIIGLKDR